MENTKLAIDVYGKWDSTDVAYITELHWVTSNEPSLTLVTFVQPRPQEGGCWPDKRRGWHRVVIKFEGISGFNLQGFGPGPQQVMGFVVDSISERGLDGLNYHVDDYENGVIEFYSRTAALLSVGPLSHSDPYG